MERIGENLETKIMVTDGKIYIDGEAVKIRKLTELERFRLMGVKDEDSAKIAKHQSKSSQCHLTGDSIIVDILMAILGVMF